jgi:hypothetical protein
MIANVITATYSLTKRHFGLILKIKIALIFLLLILLAVWKGYQRSDNDPDRGAIGIADGAFQEKYATPRYINQGWSASDSLWFYNTTQGSNLIPYDFFLVLEQPEVNSTELFRANASIDKYRYLPQKKTRFNPDALPLGFVKDEYQGKDYVGYTCAACHTGQINFNGNAVRIDGGPSMADMVGFLTALEKSLQAARDNPVKNARFVSAVKAREGDYKDTETINKDLAKWTKTIELYNTINHSHVDYGYARLDAFGRIYNRVLEHVINKEQVRMALLETVAANKTPLLNVPQVNAVLEGISETIIGDDQFSTIISRLMNREGAYPGLSMENMLLIRDNIFNEASAPVSYPFLWDITHSDYVQWNAIAANAGAGPLGRNTGEVIGVFATLDWTADKPGFNLAAFVSGQSSHKPHIDFKSSINLANLSRIETHLQTLTSPDWNEAMEKFGVSDSYKISDEKSNRGKILYAEYCQSCHQIIQPRAWDRLVTTNMSNIDVVGTDPAMAKHGVEYSGYAGNFESTYQKTDVGSLVIQNRAPVAQILTAATTGTVATPDADRNVFTRFGMWLYILAKSYADNEIKESVKAGNYLADTTANPYQSLLSYKGRSLNGIWATAPYLHNGSVPNIYSLLLPKKREGDPEGLYRPDAFQVGCRELDPVNVGLVCKGSEGFTFKTAPVGNLNAGHEYGAREQKDANGKVILDALTDAERWDLVEYIKSL